MLAKDAGRLDADERELGILKEHGQRPLRRSYVLASTAAALTSALSCRRQGW